MARITFSAAGAMMPFGSGLGSFVPTFEMFEKPKDLFAGTFANHTHNYLLESALETGPGGLILLCAFLLWLAVRVRRSWTTPRRAGIDAYWQDAAIVVIILVLGHSLVDLSATHKRPAIGFRLCMHPTDQAARVGELYKSVGFLTIALLGGT